MVDIYQYPSVSLKRIITGDRAYAERYRGEADKLLYQLKNNEKYNFVKQLKMTRYFSDNTVIRAWTHFGMDIVEIDVTGVEKRGFYPCIVELSSLGPVQPMRYPGEIHAGEVLDTDYIKTYYTFQVECIDCTLTISFSPGTTCMSLSGICWGQVLSYGKDETGPYFIWKAYTESGTYSRTGYAVLDVLAEIKSADGIVLCRDKEPLIVDCCEKNAFIRNVNIWWPIFSPGDSISYGGKTLYKVPETITAETLDNYIRVYGGYFYTVPEHDTEGGGCIPFDWLLTGYGSIASTTYGDIAAVGSEVTARGCNESTVVTVTDRCMTTDLFEAQSCCESASSLSIAYTTTQMECSDTQYFLASGGCPPYTWTLSSGGGSFDRFISKFSATGSDVYYYAPTTNANCDYNPTITLSDCCGGGESVSLAINCYSPMYAAMVYKGWDPGTCVSPKNMSPYCAADDYLGTQGIAIVHAIPYDCNGDIYNYVGVTECYCNVGLNDCLSTVPGCTAWDVYPMGYSLPCGLGGCGPAAWGHHWDQLEDLRDASTMALGCCPINPYTGVPL